MRLGMKFQTVVCWSN